MANSDGNQNWLVLYREAVLEPDRKKVFFTDTRRPSSSSHQPPRPGIVVRGVTETTECRQMDAAHFLGILRLIGEEKW